MSCPREYHRETNGVVFQVGGMLLVQCSIYAVGNRESMVSSRDGGVWRVFQNRRRVFMLYCTYLSANILSPTGKFLCPGMRGVFFTSQAFYFGSWLYKSHAPGTMVRVLGGSTKREDGNVFFFFF